MMMKNFSRSKLFSTPVVLATVLSASLSGKVTLNQTILDNPSPISKYNSILKNFIGATPFKPGPCESAWVQLVFTFDPSDSLSTLHLLY